jgi:hypothetical protein
MYIEERHGRSWPEPHIGQSKGQAGEEASQQPSATPRLAMGIPVLALHAGSVSVAEAFE